MNYTLPLKTHKSSIRKIEIDGITIGGEDSLLFMNVEMKHVSKPVVAIEVLMNLPKNYSSVLKNEWNSLVLDMCKWAEEAQKTSADMLALRFNISEDADINDEIDKAVLLFKEIQKTVKKPLIVLGSFKKEIDAKLLPALAKEAERSCIFGPVEADTYKAIVPALVENNHYVIARTPIDINLAKELNILISELGMSPDRIIVDPNMGALGYGLDYGYSIIERIKMAGLDGDRMLNMPVLTFAGEEAWKSKETKSSDFDENWGSLEDRALVWETMTASSILAAGANVVVCWHPQVCNKIKEFISR